MDENIIIPIQLNEQPALQKAKGFGLQVNNAFKAIQGFKAGRIELSLNINTGNGVTQLHNMGTAAGGAGNALRNLRPGADQAQNALLNLNRVVQDSPYGFIGIANNVNPLLESFQRLYKETGSAKGALSALATGMIGGGGLGLALAAVSSAMTFAQIGLTMWTRKTQAAKAATDAATEANKAFASEVAKGITTLTALVGIVQSHTSSLKDKKLAIAQINQDYGEYLANLGKEGVTLQNVAQAYDLVIEKMLKQAVVKGLQEQIAKQVEQTAAQIIKLEQAEKARQAAAEKANNRPSDEAVRQQKLNTYLEQRNRTVSDGAIAQQKHNTEVGKARLMADGYEAAMKRLKGELTGQLAPLLKLTDQYEELGLKLNQPKKTGLSDAARLAKEFAAAQKDLGTQTDYLLSQWESGKLSNLDYAKEKYALLKKAVEEFYTKFNQPLDSNIMQGMLLQMDVLAASIRTEKISFGTIREQVQAAAQEAWKGSENVEVPIKLGLKVITSESAALVQNIREKAALMDKGIELGITKFKWKGHLIPFNVALNPTQIKQAISQAEELQNEFNQILQNSIQNGVVALAEGIGNALVTGDWAGMFKGIKTAMGTAMQDFGKFLIKSAITIEAAKKAANWAVANPVAAVIAGGALVALGAALKANVEKRGRQPMTGFAYGGGVSGPGIVEVGEHPSTSKHNPELWGRFDQFRGLFANMITDYAKRTQTMMPAMAYNDGGGYPSEILLRADGDSLVQVLTRALARQRRTT